MVSLQIPGRKSHDVSKLCELQLRYGESTNDSKLGQPGLGDAPKVLDAVDVVRSVRKFVFAMMDAIMLLVAKIHETVIGLESVRVYN